MKPRIVSMSAVIALIVLTGSVRADDADQSNQRLQRLVTRFHKADVNGDGQLTRDEAQKGMPMVYRHFAEIDTSNKGYVTLAEIASYLEAHPQAARPHNSAPPAPAQ
jgi:Ca2+-binding EF-hand superfamily protein